MFWTRKDLKTNAKGVINKNYWTIVLASFLSAVFTAATSAGANSSNEGSDHLQKAVTNLTSNLTPTEIGLLLGAFGFVMVLCLLYTIFITNPIMVGTGRFFLETRQNEKTKFNSIFYAFRNRRWSKIVSKMFFRDLFVILWSLTIVMGVVKAYEYLMIHYIIAENPDIERKHAFKLSKQMMQGNKWKAFKLHLSFFGWVMLSVLTFGLLYIFFVGPYMNATMAELYSTLRQNAKENNFEYSEDLIGIA